MDIICEYCERPITDALISKEYRWPQSMIKDAKPYKYVAVNGHTYNLCYNCFNDVPAGDIEYKLVTVDNTSALAINKATRKWEAILNSQES